MRAFGDGPSMVNSLALENGRRQMDQRSPASHNAGDEGQAGLTPAAFLNSTYDSTK